jgi:type II secretion system protein N
MTTFRIRTLYALYSLAAAVLFLFFLFPAESIKKVAIDCIARAYPPYQIRVETLRPALPPGIQMTGLTLIDKNEPLVSVNQLKLIPALSGLIRGQLSVRFHGNAYEGKFNGDMDCLKGSWDQVEKLVLNMANLKIKEAALKSLEGAPLLSGILDGSLTYSQTEKTGDVMDATLSLTNATIALPALSAQIGEIAFEKVDAAFSIEKQTLNFRQFLFTGPQLEGNITGSVRLVAPISKSRVNLRLDVSIRPESQDRLAQLMPLVLLPNRNSNQNNYKFKIFGTLETLSFSITR